MSKIGGFLAVLAIIGFGSGVHGLRCWSCQKMTSNEECNAKGNLQTCKANQACLNQILQSNDGLKYEITKGCRRKNSPICARDNQNVGMYPTQCQSMKDQSICRCCCDTDSCNGPQLECKDVVTCKRPQNPGNGMVTCPKGINYGTKCIVKCNRGYRRQGPRTIVCTNGTDQGYWEPRTYAACLPAIRSEQAEKTVLCQKRIAAPVFGSMVCENKGEHKDKTTYNHIGTVCAFKCDPGYFLTGAESVFCLPGGSWSISVPTCIKGTCQKPPQDKNRIDDCTDDRSFGSTCLSRCKKGYRLIGSSTSTCESINDATRQGRWSEKFGKCSRALCRPELIKPPNGRLICTNRNFLGSVCTYVCNEGYDIINEDVERIEQIECVENGEVIEWNGPPPKCFKITCPRLQIPSDGSVACVGDGSVGSSCTFSCNAGFDLVGVRETTLKSVCADNLNNRDGVGVWSVETVNCAPIKCEPAREAPLNGQVYCTNENNVGSTCTFTCDAGYDMDNIKSWLLFNRCEPDPAGDGIGKWSADPATCSTRYYCQEAQVDPEHGSVTCDNEAYMGSVCQFSCDDGYQLRGFDRITCRDIKNDGDGIVEWSSEAPSCVADTCSMLWHDRFTVRAECNSMADDKQYTIGTTCIYSCLEPGYYLEGESEITCTSRNKWSANAAPRCFVITCPPLNIPENGNQPKCSNGNKYESRCNFECNPKYSLSHTDTLICEEGTKGGKVGIWDKAVPECVLSECLAIPPTPSRGTVTCSSGASIGSYCTLECTQGYAPKVRSIDCRVQEQRTENGVKEIPRFSLLKDFCCAECRSDFHIGQIADLRFRKNLESIVGFTKMLLTQLVGQENQAYFSTFAYGDEVDDSTVIPREKLENMAAIDNIVKQMEKWEVTPGLKSDTRGALDYVNDQLFEGVDSNAASFLIIAADDAPDNVRKGSIARILDRGINIIVAASNNFAKLTWDKLLGSDENVVNQDANEIMKRIYELAFKNGCPNTAPRCV
ncbi:P-selectin-like [Styela clava]